MGALITVLLAACTCGFAAWAVDRHRSAYGVLLLPGLSVLVGGVAWAVLAATPLAYAPGFDWILWAAPVLLAAVAAAGGVRFIGRPRAAADTARLTAALR